MLHDTDLFHKPLFQKWIKIELFANMLCAILICAYSMWQKNNTVQRYSTENLIVQDGKTIDDAKKALIKVSSQWTIQFAETFMRAVFSDPLQTHYNTASRRPA